MLSRLQSLGGGMLVIRTAQMEAFRSLTEKLFAQRLCILLRQYQADDCIALGDEELHAFVEQQLLRARHRGFTWETSLGDFVSLSLSVGVNFDQHQFIAPLLDDTSIDIDHRLMVVQRTLEVRDWDEVRNSCSNRAPA